MTKMIIIKIMIILLVLGKKSTDKSENFISWNIDQKETENNNFDKSSKKQSSSFKIVLIK